MYGHLYFNTWILILHHYLLGLLPNQSGCLICKPPHQKKVIFPLSLQRLPFQCLSANKFFMRERFKFTKKMSVLCSQTREPGELNRSFPLFPYSKCCQSQQGTIKKSRFILILEEKISLCVWKNNEKFLCQFFRQVYLFSFFEAELLTLYVGHLV